MLEYEFSLYYSSSTTTFLFSLFSLLKVLTGVLEFPNKRLLCFKLVKGDCILLYYEMNAYVRGDFEKIKMQRKKNYFNFG